MLAFMYMFLHGRARVPRLDTRHVHVSSARGVARGHDGRVHHLHGGEKGTGRGPKHAKGRHEHVQGPVAGAC